MHRVIAALALLFTFAAHASPEDDARAAQLHELKRAYLQAQLDEARAREVETRAQGAALVGASVALPVVTLAGALGAVALASSAADERVADAAVGAGTLLAGSGLIASCVLSPYTLLTGLTRFSDAELADEEVTARAHLLAQHDAQAPAARSR